MNKHPIIAVGIIVYRKTGEILLVQSPKWKSGWIIPGGHLEFGEALTDAAIRETKEETNLNLSNLTLLTTLEYLPSEGHYKAEKHFVFIEFMGLALNPEDIELNEELSNYQWIAPNDALTLTMTTQMKTLIELFIEKQQTLNQLDCQHQ